MNTKTKKIKGIGEVTYLPKRSFTKTYSKEKGGYQVVGAIGKVPKKIVGQCLYQEQPLVYYEIQYSKFQAGICGYVEIEKDVFVAIVESKIGLRLFQLLGIVGLLVCVVLGGMYLLQPKKSYEIDPGAGKYKPDVTMPEKENGNIVIPGYGDFYVKANSDHTAYIALMNPEGNPCYFRFRIVLDTQKRVLYESKLIPPGYAVTKVPLGRTFEAGQHPVTVQVETYDLKDPSVRLNGAEVKTKILAVVPETK